MGPNSSDWRAYKREERERRLRDAEETQRGRPREDEGRDESKASTIQETSQTASGPQKLGERQGIWILPSEPLEGIILPTP